MAILGPADIPCLSAVMIRVHRAVGPAEYGTQLHAMHVGRPEPWRSKLGGLTGEGTVPCMSGRTWSERSRGRWRTGSS